MKLPTQQAFLCRTASCFARTDMDRCSPGLADRRDALTGRRPPLVGGTGARTPARMCTPHRPSHLHSFWKTLCVGGACPIGFGCDRLLPGL